MEKEHELEIQVSSTTLGYEGKGGTLNIALALIEGAISKEAYTYLVKNNAEKFQDETKKEIPNAQFGVSVLASAVNAKMMGDLIKSVDYPYAVQWGLDFLKEKRQKGKEEGYKGKDAVFALGAELGYAMLQARPGRGQVDRTVKVAKVADLDPVRIRTCIETVGIEDEIKKIKKVNTKLSKEKKNVIWVIEPNKKIGENTLSSFLQMYENVVKEYPELSFGIDLDMGGLSEEKSLLSVLDRMDKKRILPLFISLSGQGYIDGNVRTHLPLGEDREENRKLGEWMDTMQQRGNPVPGLVIETSPAQDEVLRDYSKFLKDLKKGL